MIGLSLSYAAFARSYASIELRILLYDKRLGSVPSLVLDSIFASVLIAGDSWHSMRAAESLFPRGSRRRLICISAPIAYGKTKRRFALCNFTSAAGDYQSQILSCFVSDSMVLPSCGPASITIVIVAPLSKEHARIGPLNVSD